jgi:hypothetical protein
MRNAAEVIALVFYAKGHYFVAIGHEHSFEDPHVIGRKCSRN